MKALFTLYFTAFTLGAHAQLTTPTKDFAVRGKFYVSVDDSAAVYHNGAHLHKAPINESSSPEIELRPGDRVVVRLRNELAGRRFLLVFLATDRQFIVNFDYRAFKIPTDPEGLDFTPAQFVSFTKQPKVDRTRRPQHFQFKHSSDWVWGESDRCTLASLIARQMFVPLPKP